MSDQVEIVAAEDAATNREGEETVASVQATSEEPEATKAEAGRVKKPVAEATVETSLSSDTPGTTEVSSERDPVAEKSPEEPLVDGPVGEVLDDSNDVPAGALDTPVAEASAETSSEHVPIVEQSEKEALVDGPVGEVLEASNDTSERAAADQIAEATLETSSDNARVAEQSPVLEQIDGEQLVDGPVGEVLDDNNDAPAGGTSSAEAEGSKSTVRILSVGQQVTGTVKRIAEFGAFVDIGVGRDGLIHISELSVRRVGKVTDVLSEGQEVTAWIKKLDRDRNRISLTLIDPNTKTIRDLNKDDLVQGTVTRILPYGAFIDIGIGRDALLHVREMGVGYVAKPEDVVKVGDSVEARIIELSRRRGRVDLSLKGLRAEPEPPPPPQPAPVQPPPQQSNPRRQPDPEPEVEEEDDFEDVDVLSPMELAFKRAMEAEGIEVNISRKKQNKRNRRERSRSVQDEIITRTLSSGKK
jgi:predicted RNA-binding protein with RPS1 domain